MGIEGGYLIKENLWMSLGYNFAGFSDRDLTGTDYTNRGVYVRLRYKFDEDLFAGDDPQVNHTARPGRATKAMRSIMHAEAFLTRTERAPRHAGAGAGGARIVATRSARPGAGRLARAAADTRALRA